MVRTNQQSLIIITGPVGGGKSTTSLALARSLRRPDVTAAVIDLDQVYGFVRQQDGYDEPLAWWRARQGAAALANTCFHTGMGVVIVEGEFFNAEELGAVTALIDAPVVCHFVTLRLSYARALARVQGDLSRGASKNPATLKWLHESFVQALAFLETASVVIDTDDLAQDAVVTRLVALVSKASER
jgi:hypothetical protein